MIKHASILRVNLATTAEALLSDIFKTFTDPKRAKTKEPRTAPSPALARPKLAQGDYSAGLDFSKVARDGAVSPPPPSPSPSPAPEAEPPPPSLPSAQLQVPSPQLQRSVTSGDPYERLEVAVLKGLLKEEGLFWSTVPEAYAALFAAYFPEEVEPDDAPDDIEFDLEALEDLNGWEEVLD